MGKLISKLFYFCNEWEPIIFVMGILSTMAIIVCVPLLFLSYIYTILKIYLLIAAALFVLSGRIKYEEQRHRKWALAVAFLWPIFLIGFAVPCGFYGLYRLHEKVGEIKLPKRKVRIDKKLLQEKMPKVGAYRDTPEKCKTCGHLLEHEIHEVYDANGHPRILPWSKSAIK